MQLGFPEIKPFQADTPSRAQRRGDCKKWPFVCHKRMQEHKNSLSCRRPFTEKNGVYKTPVVWSGLDQERDLGKDSPSIRRCLVCFSRWQFRDWFDPSCGNCISCLRIRGGHLQRQDNCCQKKFCIHTFYLLIFLSTRVQKMVGAGNDLFGSQPYGFLDVIGKSKEKRSSCRLSKWISLWETT